MTPDQGKPGPSPVEVLNIPAAKGGKRHLTAEITTLSASGRGGLIEATYREMHQYPSPSHAPVFARMSKCRGGWRGEIVLQTFCKSEADAVASLISALAEWGVEPHEKLCSLRPLTSALRDSDRPWDQQDMGTRGRKPRRARAKWRNAAGKRVHVYKDTLQVHAHLTSEADHG